MSLFYMEIRYKSDLHLSRNNLYMHEDIYYLCKIPDQVENIKYLSMEWLSWYRPVMANL